MDWQFGLFSLVIRLVSELSLFYWRNIKRYFSLSESSDIQL